MDHKTQTIIYALDAIEFSIKANLKLVTALKALVAPSVYVCDLEPSDLNRRPGKVFTFEPPANSCVLPVCLDCHRPCHMGEILKECPDYDECVNLSCVDCDFRSRCD